MGGHSKLADGSTEVRARIAGRKTTTTRMVEVRIRDGGHVKLKEELGVLQPGVVVLMFRSPLHHLAREGDKSGAGQ